MMCFHYLKCVDKVSANIKLVIGRVHVINETVRLLLIRHQEDIWFQCISYVGRIYIIERNNL